MVVGLYFVSKVAHDHLTQENYPMPQDPNVTYLGDGAYARFGGHQVELYSSNGVSVNDQIFLEPSALKLLIEFLKARGWQL